MDQINIGDRVTATVAIIGEPPVTRPATVVSIWPRSPGEEFSRYTVRLENGSLLRGCHPDSLRRDEPEAA